MKQTGIIVGYAVLYDVRTLRNELFRPGCLDRSLARIQSGKQVCRIDIDHCQVIGSTRRGNLHLAPDSVGVRFRYVGPIPDDIAGLSCQCSGIVSIKCDDGVELILDAKLERVTVVVAPAVPCVPRTKETLIIQERTR